MNTWLAPGIAALILWGFWGFFPKLTLNFLDTKSAVLYEVLGAVFVALIILIGLEFRPQFHAKGFLFAFITGACAIGGAWFFLTALNVGKVSVVAPFTAMYPLLSVVLAVIFLGETISLKEGIGIAFAVASMLLLAS